MREHMTDDDLHAVTAASAGLRGSFVHMPATGNVVFSPRDTDELHTIAEDLEPHVADPLVVMLDGVPRLLAEVARLTQERDEERRRAERAEDLHAAACIEWDKAEQERDAAKLEAEITSLRAELDAATAAARRWQSRAESTYQDGVREVAGLVAELESLAPHTRDTETEPDAAVLAAPVRCDCCSVTIPAGDSAVMFADEAGRECWAHYARCPFEERMIALAFARGERREVAALVYGLWAMHRDADGLDWHNGRETLSWRVTHVPSGLAISNGWYTEREARRIVQRLGVSFSSDRFAVLATKTEEARLIGAAVEEALHG